MKIRCDKCKSKIKKPGALLFGPPLMGRTKKWHLCRPCYEQIVKFLR